MAWIIKVIKFLFNCTSSPFIFFESKEDSLSQKGYMEGD